MSPATMLNIKRWLYAGATSAISAIAHSVVGSVGLMFVDPKTFNVGPGLVLMLKTSAVMSLLAGVVAFFAYLQQAPLPKWDGDERREGRTTTTTTAVVVERSTGPTPPTEPPQP